MMCIQFLAFVDLVVQKDVLVKTHECLKCYLVIEQLVTVSWNCYFVRVNCLFVRLHCLSVGSCFVSRWGLGFEAVGGNHQRCRHGMLLRLLGGS